MHNTDRVSNNATTAGANIEDYLGEAYIFLSP
jgi:hypothetical protein